MRAFHSFPHKDPHGKPIIRPSGSSGSNPVIDPSLRTSTLIQSSSSTTIDTIVNTEEEKDTSTSNVSSSTLTKNEEETTVSVVPPEALPSTTTIPPTANPLLSVPSTGTSTSFVSSSTSTVPSSHSLSSTSSSSSSVMNLQPFIRYTPQNKQIPLSNGGVGPGYWWSQTLTEITIHVEFPKDVRAKDIQVLVKPQYLTLGLRDKLPVIDGILDGKVQSTDMVWNLEGESDRQIRPIDPTGQGNASIDSGVINPSNISTGATKGKVLTLVLDKIIETWWKSIVVGHPEIDPTAVDSTLPVDAYDPDTQAAIRKVVFDQQQKAQGLPTSEEIKAQTLIDRAKLLPGSPFLPDGPLANSVPLPFSFIPSENDDEEEKEDDDNEDGTKGTEGWTTIEHN